MTLYQRRQWEAACKRWERAEEFPPRRSWSDTDDAFLRKHYASKGDVWCGVRLNRTAEAVRWHMVAIRAQDALAEFSRQYLQTLSPRA